MGLHGAVLLWIALTSSIAVVSGTFKYSSTICLKENFNAKKNELIKTTANDFKDFVRNSDIFVDKSLLVNLVTQVTSFVSLTYPTKWGKSINLGMIRTFLEIEMDQSATKVPLKQTWGYRFFKYGEIIHENGSIEKLKHPPAIAENEQIIKTHLSRYPVIYLNLSGINAITHDFNGVVKSFQKRIASAFKRHDYMIEVFRDEMESDEVKRDQRLKTKKLLETFKQYRAGEMDSPESTITSLEFLSSVLRSYFNQRVYILIDDYDAVIRKLYLETSLLGSKDGEKMLKLFFKFMSTTFETNNDLKMGIVTGMFDLQLFDNHSSSFEIVNYHLLSKNTVPFYGLTTHEIKQLASYCFVSKNSLKELYKNHHGYHVGDFPDITVYNPWSIANFVNGRKIIKPEFKIPSFIPSNKAVRDILRQLVEESKVGKVRLQNLTFNREELTLLSTEWKGAETHQKNAALVKLIYTHIWASGSLTLEVPMLVNDTITDIKFKILHQEMVKKMFEMSIEADLKKAASIAAKLIDENLLKLGKYQDYGHVSSQSIKLANLHKTAIKEIQKGPSSLDDNNDFIKHEEVQFAHFLQLYYLKENHGYRVGLNVSYYQDWNELRPYIVLYNGVNGAIVEFECGRKTNDKSYFSLARIALNRAKRFEGYFAEKGYFSGFTRYIGVGLVPSLCELEIQVDTNSNIDE